MSMNQIFERIGDAIFGVFNFFDSVKVRRGDDLLFAEFKRIQLAIVVGVGAIVVLGLLTVVLPDGSSAGSDVAGMLVGQLQRRVQGGVAVLLVAASAWTAFGLWTLYRFMKKHGLE